jgi:hypothetical protein
VKGKERDEGETRWRGNSCQGQFAINASDTYNGYTRDLLHCTVLKVHD